MSRSKKKSLPHGLGKSLMKKHPMNERISSSTHSAELNDGYDWGCLQSITEQNDLDEFLLMAEVTGKEYAEEKMNVTFVNPNVGYGVLSPEEKIKISNLHEQYKNYLRIPRRPQWNESTTAEELNEKEKENFLQWRRQLAEIQEVEGIIFTPFEKNLEFWRQLWRVVERSDIVVQTVDARNSCLFRCEDLETYVKETNPEKINMILVNKADLLTQEQRQIWAKYFDSIHLPCAFFSALEQGEASLKDTALEENTDMEEDTSLAPGQLLSRKQLLNFFRKLKPISSESNNKVITIGLVGYPNVGKSSTINCLMTYKKVSVSATPGKTKHFQTLNVDDDICLCDCPGLVMPSFVATKADLIINGILPIDQMKDHVPPVNLILSRIPRHVLEMKYGIHLPPVPEGEPSDRPPTAEEFLNAYGYMRGFMTQRGLPDHPRSARYILKDYVQGKLLYCHAPPDVCQSEYHYYSPPLKISEPTFTPQEMKINDISSGSKDLDKAFFNKVSISAHSKGIQLIGGQAKRIDRSSTDINNENGKPWKKHYNKNKKEKLRRIYAELDK